MAWQAANELREFIGKIPNLSIFIDEVHHATASNNNDNEVKLRKVVSQWSKRESVITIAGFSGTPYLKSEEKIPINSSLTIKHKQIANTVYYYPLLKGIGNFLKTPIVKISNSTNRLDIVEAGLREFLENSRLYENSLHSKIAIYCASIKNLEEQIYPKVCAILSEYQLNQTAVLKFHRGDKDKIYPEPENAQSTFDTLDYNKNIKVVLLVDIGKEGWDCKSLSGVILSQENKSKKNMVLQTSCRCLRQIDKNADEKALIYLNDSNAKELSSQLKAEQKIDIDEFQSGAKNEQIAITRYDRTDKIKLPPLEFYQIKLHYDKTITQEANPKEALVNLNLTKQDENLIIQKDFKDKIINTFLEKNSQKEQHANFTQWLYEIAKDSLNTLSLSSLKAHAPALRDIFAKITHSQNDRLYFKAEFNKAAINSSIRKAFSPKRNFTTTTELVPQSARLLLADKLYSPLMINSRSQENAFIPNQEITKEIIRLDKENTPQAMPTNEEKETLIKFLGEKDAKKYIANKEKTLTSHYLSHKDKSFHYIPYRTDSKLERTIFDKILQADEFKALNLELYYNGDRSLSEFHIQTYKDNAKLGLYTPDFLVLKRKNGVISKLLIVESKGEIYALNFEHKKKFMDEFIALNNEKSGYAKFGFLYIEDTQSESEQIIKIQSEIQNFFKDKD